MRSLLGRGLRDLHPSLALGFCRRASRHASAPDPHSTVAPAAGLFPSPGSARLPHLYLQPHSRPNVRAQPTLPPIHHPIANHKTTSNACRSSRTTLGLLPSLPLAYPHPRRLRRPRHASVPVDRPPLARLAPSLPTTTTAHTRALRAKSFFFTIDSIAVTTSCL